MPKISALKFIDEAIIPIALIIGTKFLSILILTIILGFSWSFDSEVKNRLLFFSFDHFNDLIIVSNISDLAALVISSVGFSWVILRSRTFRKDLIHPVTEVKLRQKSQEGLILSAEESLHQESVWLVASWFLMFFVLNNVLVGTTSFFVLGIGIGINTALTLAFYRDLVRDYPEKT